MPLHWIDLIGASVPRILKVEAVFKHVVLTSTVPKKNECKTKRETNRNKNKLTPDESGEKKTDFFGRSRFFL